MEYRFASLMLVQIMWELPNTRGESTEVGTLIMHVGFEMLIAVYVCSWTRRETDPPGKGQRRARRVFKKQDPKRKENEWDFAEILRFRAGISRWSK